MKPACVDTFGTTGIFLQEEAFEKSQKYKEGKFILERCAQAVKPKLRAQIWAALEGTALISRHLWTLLTPYSQHPSWFHPAKDTFLGGGVRETLLACSCIRDKFTI